MSKKIKRQRRSIVESIYRKATFVMTSFSDVLAAAATHFQNNRLADAAKICEHVLGQSPDNSEALHLLGLVHFVGGNKGASVAYLRRAVAVAPANAPFWNNLGYICIGDGKFEEGVAACEQAVRLVPNFPDPYNNLGLAYEHLGLFQDADRCYRHAIALGRNLLRRITISAICFSARTRSKKRSPPISMLYHSNRLFPRPFPIWAMPWPREVISRMR